MTSIRRAVVFGVIACLWLGGCAGSRAPERQGSAAQKAACRQRADEVYSKQNRAEVYRSDTYLTTTRDSPFATSGLPGITSRGLSGQYARDTLVRDCLNNTAGNVGSTLSETPTESARTAPTRRPTSFSPLAVPPGP